jgi:ribosomal protein S16
MTNITKKFRYDNKLFKSHFLFKMRFVRYRQYQRVFYKMVVVNRYNTIVAHLGFYSPFAVNLNLSYRSVHKPLFFSKIVGIDRLQVMFWLKRGAVPTPMVMVILKAMGLIKLQSVSRDQTVLNKYIKNRAKFLDSQYYASFFKKHLEFTGRKFTTKHTQFLDVFDLIYL